MKKRQLESLPFVAQAYLQAGYIASFDQDPESAEESGIYWLPVHGVVFAQYRAEFDDRVIEWIEDLPGRKQQLLLAVSWHKGTVELLVEKKEDAIHFLDDDYGISPKSGDWWAVEPILILEQIVFVS